MSKLKPKIFRAIGLAGTIFCVVVFARRPSFPTPDKLFVFLLFGFMIFGQARVMFKRFFPFIFLILTYESFRSVADQLNKHVNYSLNAHADKLLFGDSATARLQHWLWRGHTSWYDYVLYLPYLLHFVLPFVLGIAVWKTREKHYWRVMNTYIVVAFAAFLTFLVLPTAPPWLASNNHFISPVVRISSSVWAGLGLRDFPSFYNNITPNQVAAVPSLHAAWATLLLIFVYQLYGRRWALLAAVYPLLIYFGTVYEAEHYAFDIFSGIIYAVACYLITPFLMRLSARLWRQYARNLKINLKRRTYSVGHDDLGDPI